MSLLRYENVEWALPGLFGFEDKVITAKILFDELGIPFKCNIFGAPRTKWSGGRTSYIQTENREFIKRLFSYLVNLGITPSLNFTNYHIQKEDLDDPLCNYFLDVANDLGGNIIISSDMLLDYIKSKYSNLKYTSSVIRPAYNFHTPDKINKYHFEEEIAFYNELLKKYDKVVVRPEFAKYYLPDNYQKINDISRIEVLINQSCHPNCPIAMNHYKYCEDVENGRIDESFECYLIKTKSSALDQMDSNLYLRVKDVDNLVNNIGVKYLKMQSEVRHALGARTFLSFCLYVLNADIESIIFSGHLEGKAFEIEESFKKEMGID